MVERPESVRGKRDEGLYLMSVEDARRELQQIDDDLRKASEKKAQIEREINDLQSKRVTAVNKLQSEQSQTGLWK